MGVWRLASGAMTEKSLAPHPGITAVAVGDPEGGPAPAGPYAQCARVEFGGGALLQLSGQVAVDDDGTLVGQGDVAAQTSRSSRTSSGSSRPMGRASATS